MAVADSGAARSAENVEEKVGMIPEKTKANEITGAHAAKPQRFAERRGAVEVVGPAWLSCVMPRAHC